MKHTRSYKNKRAMKIKKCSIVFFESEIRLNNSILLILLKYTYNKKPEIGMFS